MAGETQAYPLSAQLPARQRVMVARLALPVVGGHAASRIRAFEQQQEAANWPDVWLWHFPARQSSNHWGSRIQ